MNRSFEVGTGLLFCIWHAGDSWFNYVVNRLVTARPSFSLQLDAADDRLFPLWPVNVTPRLILISQLGGAHDKRKHLVIDTNNFIIST